MGNGLRMAGVISSYRPGHHRPRFPFRLTIGIIVALPDTADFSMTQASRARRFVARRSPIHGNGVFAVSSIACGEHIIQYKGKLLTQAEADELYGDGGETGHTFLFTLNDDYVIDANQQGNSARWINHSCTPNCRAVVEESASGDPRRDKVMIEAIRAIEPGEELTYDYGIVLDVPHTARLKKRWACRCGSPECTGTLLKPKPRRA